VAVCGRCCVTTWNSSRTRLALRGHLRVVSGQLDVSTVFVRQGHYARDPDVSHYGKPDVTIERIADILGKDLPAWMDPEG